LIEPENNVFGEAMMKIKRLEFDSMAYSHMAQGQMCLRGYKSKFAE
jgi:hypothetical protein